MFADHSDLNIPQLGFGFVTVFEDHEPPKEKKIIIPEALIKREPPKKKPPMGFNNGR